MPTHLTTTDKGAANGVASLGSDGKVPSSQLPAGGPGGATWGGISGTLSDQTDLNSALAGKEAAGTAASAVASHAAAADPHTGYMRESVYDAANIAQQVLGTSATQTVTGKTINDPTNYVDADAIHFKVLNNSGGSLTAGTPVVLTQWNAISSAIEVVKARANSASTMPAIGLIEATLADGAVGEVRFAGTLNGVNTNAWSDGTKLYVSAASAGTLTSTRPTGATDVIQHVATVVRQHATAGVLAVHGSSMVTDVPNSISADLIADGTTNKAYTATEQTKLSGIAAGATVGADWNTNVTNKPTLGTAAAQNITAFDAAGAAAAAQAASLPLHGKADTAGTADTATSATTAGNLSGTPTLPNGTTATTQTAGDNSTKLATTAYARSAAPNGRYRTILQASGSHTAAKVAGTYGLGQGDVAAVSGTGTLYPLATIAIASADYPTVDGLAPKLRVRFNINCNDVAPFTGTFVCGLHPVTRPATSGGAGLCIYTIGTAATGSTVTGTNLAADSANLLVGSDFSLPSDGQYVLAFVTNATMATSSHVHVSAILQARNA